MTVLQTGRYNEMLDKRGAQGTLSGMDADFIKQVTSYPRKRRIN